MTNPEAVDAANYIRELRIAASEASLNYDVWWALMNRENRTAYVETMNWYATYFATTVNAHFVAMLIPLYRLYEDKADTFNIPKLVEHLHRDGKLTHTVRAEVDALLAQALPIWKRIGVLRNRVFGHRSRAHTTAQLFKAARITPDELGELVKLTKATLNTLSQAVQQDQHAFNREARTDVIRLLDDLKSFHEQDR